MSLNVLAIYPGMAKQKNDNAFVLIRLHEKGTKLTIIASRSLGLKGKGQLPSYENMDGIDVYRFHRNLLDTLVFPRRYFNKILRATADLNPDLISCSQESNMRLALLLQRHFHVPIGLLVEDAGRIQSGEANATIKTKILFRVLGLPTGSKYLAMVV